MRVSFFILAVLNMLDMCFTAIGLQYGHIQEGNPMMASLWAVNPAFFIMIKMVLSALLILLAIYFVPSPANRRRWKLVLSVAVVGYLVVFSLHITWMTMSIG